MVEITVKRDRCGTAGLHRRTEVISSCGISNLTERRLIDYWIADEPDPDLKPEEGLVRHPTTMRTAGNLQDLAAAFTPY